MNDSQFSSVQFSRSVVSDSLRPHELQHTRPPCPSPSPRVHTDSRPSSQWCHPAISSPVIPFSSCPQSLPASESFPMCQLFAWGGQSTGVSALASFLPKKSQSWYPSQELLIYLGAVKFHTVSLALQSNCWNPGRTWRGEIGEVLGRPPVPVGLRQHDHCHLAGMGKQRSRWNADVILVTRKRWHACEAEDPELRQL